MYELKYQQVKKLLEIIRVPKAEFITKAIVYDDAIEFIGINFKYIAIINKTIRNSLKSII